MTHSQLHEIPKFVELFEDPRFIQLSNYMREHIGKSLFDTAQNAEAMIFRGAFKDGWLDAINAMPTLATPPRPDAPPKDQRLYAERPR